MTESGPVVVLRGTEEGRDGGKRSQEARGTSGGDDMFITWTAVLVSWAYTQVEAYQIVCFPCAQSIHQLYLNKSIFKTVIPADYKEKKT